MSDQKLDDKPQFSLKAEHGYLFPKALQIHHVAISNSGKQVALASQENGTALFDVKSGKRLKIIANDNGKKKHPQIENMSVSVANQVLSVSFSPDGRLLATTDMFGVKIRKIPSGSLVSDLAAPFRYGRSRTVFSQDGKLLMRYQTDKRVVLWNSANGELVADWKTGAQSAAFARNSNEIAVGFSDRKTGISVFDFDGR